MCPEAKSFSPASVHVGKKAVRLKCLCIIVADIDGHFYHMAAQRLSAKRKRAVDCTSGYNNNNNK